MDDGNQSPSRLSARNQLTAARHEKGNCDALKEGKGKSFFSEEKKQKTFISWSAPTIPAMAGMVEAAEKQKSFGSFLQKGTYLLSASLKLGSPLDIQTCATVFWH